MKKDLRRATTLTKALLGRQPKVKVRKMLKSASWRAKDLVGKSPNLSAILI
ncbi:hypothetical protein H5410_015118 [Solanum commersonii]|uniref:Uncharacterized protein n=1 Tax=Solanum commersonii TaxID=4109 RepID=A0A9J5ZST8_SOLCO|nr:hypothetical protein H5410_015118 [Solanum commersonii]